MIPSRKLVLILATFQPTWFYKTTRWIKRYKELASNFLAELVQIGQKIFVVICRLKLVIFKRALIKHLMKQLLLKWVCNIQSIENKVIELHLSTYSMQYIFFVIKKNIINVCILLQQFYIMYICLKRSCTRIYECTKLFIVQMLEIELPKAIKISL